MGDYADLAIEETIGDWDGCTDVGYCLSPIALKHPKTCQRCGKRGLYWRKIGSAWKLHHWALLACEKKPRFVPHRCGFTSDGTPTSPTEPAVNTPAGAGNSPVGEEGLS